MTNTALLLALWRWSREVIKTVYLAQEVPLMVILQFLINIQIQNWRIWRHMVSLYMKGMEKNALPKVTSSLSCQKCNGVLKKSTIFASAEWSRGIKLACNENIQVKYLKVTQWQNVWLFWSWVSYTLYNKTSKLLLLLLDGGPGKNMIKYAPMVWFVSV